MIKKILLALILIPLLLTNFFLFTPGVNAENKCAGDTAVNATAYKPGTQTPADQTDNKIDLVINTNSQLQSISPDSYDIVYTDPSGQKESTYKGNVTSFNPDSQGSFSFSSINYYGEIGGEGRKNFPIGSYRIQIYQGVGGDAPIVCETNFTIAGSTTGPDNYCTIEVTNANEALNTHTPVQFKVYFPSKDGPPTDPNVDSSVQPDHGHAVYLQDNDTGYLYPKMVINTSDLEAGNEPQMPVLSTGNYNIEVRQNSEDVGIFSEGKVCDSQQGIHIGPQGGYLGCKVDTDCGTANPACADQGSCLCLPAIVSPAPGATSAAIGSLVCRTPSSQEGRNPCIDKGNNSFVCQTAIGAISADPAGFAKGVLQLFLAIGGLILLFTLILNGYKFMTSQGDKEKVQEARDSITSAVAGLLLIIFAIVILQFITVDLFHLPGFKP